MKNLSELFLDECNGDYSDSKVLQALLKCVEEMSTRDVSHEECRDLWDVTREFLDEE